MRTLTTKTRIVTVIADFDNENQDHMLVPISSLNLHVMEDHGRKPPTTFYLLQDSVPLLSLLSALSSISLIYGMIDISLTLLMQLIPRHAWLLIIDDEDNNWHLIMHDYWLLMMRKTLRIVGGGHLWHDWHIIKIIDTINTSLWGLTLRMGGGVIYGMIDTS